VSERLVWERGRRFTQKMFGFLVWVLGLGIKFWVLGMGIGFGYKNFWVLGIGFWYICYSKSTESGHFFIKKIPTIRLRLKVKIFDD